MCMVTQWAKTAFLAGLGGVRGGTLTLECPDRTYRFGGHDGHDDPDRLDATMIVRDDRFFLRALTGSDIGIGESFRLFQLVLVKNGSRRALFNEPWSDTARVPRSVAASESAA